MRAASSVTSISWIPSEAIQGSMKLPFSMGIAHYDEPPPDRVEGPEALAALRDADRFRFANRLEAWIDVDDDGTITAYGQDSAACIGSTTLRLGKTGMTFQAVPLPELRPEPVVGDGWVRFQQTAGGRTGVPAPRRVRRRPFIQYHAPLAWTTLSLTLHADGRVEREVVGASPFPRHWVYDGDGELVAKTGLVRFKDWYREAFGTNSPWGDQDSPALVTEIETALERQLSKVIMGGGKPQVRKIDEGECLVQQGDEGDDLFLLLDGVLEVDVDGDVLAALGPGAILGERAILEGGLRTCTLRAVTACKVAVAGADGVDTEALRQISEGHRREEQR